MTETSGRQDRLRGIEDREAVDRERLLMDERLHSLDMFGDLLPDGSARKWLVILIRAGHDVYGYWAGETACIHLEDIEITVSDYLLRYPDIWAG